VLECGKAGWCFVIDRANGKLLFRSDEVAPHQNTYAAGSPTGITVAPGTGGAVSVSPVSYDPVSGVVYVASRHAPSVQTLVKVPNVPGGPALSKLVSKPVPASETWGTLTALDLANGGRVLWQVKTPEPLVGGTLATAGGLVFTGEANGHFNAYDAATGKALWTHQTGVNVSAPPMSLRGERAAVHRRRHRRSRGPASGRRDRPWHSPCRDSESTIGRHHGRRGRHSESLKLEIATLLVARTGRRLSVIPDRSARLLVPTLLARILPVLLDGAFTIADRLRFDDRRRSRCLS
jgi:hypothetical protein